MQFPKPSYERPSRNNRETQSIATLWTWLIFRDTRKKWHFINSANTLKSLIPFWGTNFTSDNEISWLSELLAVSFKICPISPNESTENLFMQALTYEQVGNTLIPFLEAKVSNQTLKRNLLHFAKLNYRANPILFDSTAISSRTFPCIRDETTTLFSTIDKVQFFKK